MCGAAVVRAVSVVVLLQMIVVSVYQMGCVMVWVDKSMVGTMGNTGCSCEEACDVFVSVLGVVQVNVQR